MQIKKYICGLLFAFGIIIFAYGQQENQSPECLNQANDYKNSVFILIDPGHGCPSSNGISCNPDTRQGAEATYNYVTYSEDCMTTDLALRLRDILEGLGLDVGMTRNTNIAQTRNAKAIQIQNQIISAKGNKDDNIKPYFISIHFNGGPAAAHGNNGIYAHSNRTGESVANIVSNAQNTVFVNKKGQPIANTYPQVTLHDNQNILLS
jgi:N-acetylmuramoyl-L-alanine amidase